MYRSQRNTSTSIYRLLLELRFVRKKAHSRENLLGLDIPRATLICSYFQRPYQRERGLVFSACPRTPPAPAYLDTPAQVRRVTCSAASRWHAVCKPGKRDSAQTVAGGPCPFDYLISRERCQQKRGGSIRCGSAGRSPASALPPRLYERSEEMTSVWEWSVVKPANLEK